MTELVRFLNEKEDIFGVYKNEYDGFDKEDFLSWLADREQCLPENIIVELYEIDEIDDDIEITHCDECGRISIYHYKGNEHSEIVNYVCYGNKEKKLIQNIVPDMPAWVREGFIRGGMGCVCPTCLKNMF